MPSQKNQAQLKVLQDKFADAESVVIVDYAGTNASEQVKLRSEIKEAGGEFVVTKNNLIKLAAAKSDLDESLTGMNALVISYQDPVAAVKKLFDFHKESEKLEIKQGWMEDKVLSFGEIEALSKLPSKDQLIATLISRLKGPGQGMVNVLNAGLRDLVGVLKAVATKTAPTS